MNARAIGNPAPHGPLVSFLRRIPSVVIASVILSLVLMSASAVAQRTMRRRGTPTDAVARPATAAPFGGSELDYRNVVSAKTFDRDGDLTYNPYYAMELHIAPAFRMGPYVRAKLDVLLSRELTHSDTTTKRGETVLGDIFLELERLKGLTIPVVKIKLSSSFRLYVPSSKISQARTLILGVRPELALSRKLKVFDGLVFAYVVSVRKNFHESTTAAIEAPLIRPDYGSSRSLESFSNLGLRNVTIALTNIFSVSLAFKKRFALLLAMGLSHGFLYRLEDEDPRISYSPGSDTRVRYLMTYTGELSYQPRRRARWLTLALGFLTQNPQLASDATYEAPFFNRYTSVFFDMRMDVERLATRLLKPKRKKQKRKK